MMSNRDFNIYIEDSQNEGEGKGMVWESHNLELGDGITLNCERTKSKNLIETIDGSRIS